MHSWIMLRPVRAAVVRRMPQSMVWSYLCTWKPPKTPVISKSYDINSVAQTMHLWLRHGGRLTKSVVKFADVVFKSSRLHPEYSAQQCDTIANMFLSFDRRKLTLNLVCRIAYGLRAVLPYASPVSCNACLSLYEEFLSDVSKEGTSNDYTKMLSGIQHIHPSNPFIRRIIPLLTSRLAAPTILFSDAEAGGLFAALQHMTDDTSEVRALLSMLAHKIATGPQLGERAIAYMLFGLKRMHGCPEVMLILEAAALQLNSSSDIFSSHSLGNAFYGLKNIHREPPELVLVLRALLPKLRRAHRLDNVAVANIMFGLQNVSNNLTVVQDILEAMLPHIAAMKQPHAQTLMSCYVGLQRCQSDSSARAIVAALNKHASTAKLDAKAVNAMVYGLRHMTHHKAEVVESILIATTVLESGVNLSEDNVALLMHGLRSTPCNSNTQRLIEIITRQFSIMQGVSMSNLARVAYGMQRLSSHHPIVLELLRHLTVKIQSCTQPASCVEISKFCLGMRSMSSHLHEVQKYIRIVTQMLRECTESFEPLELTHCLAGLESLSGDDMSVNELIAELNIRLRGLSDPVYYHMLSTMYLAVMNKSDASKEAVSMLHNLNKILLLCPNAYIVGHRLCDIVMRLHRMSSTCDAAANTLKIVSSRLPTALDVTLPSIFDALWGLQSMTLTPDVDVVIQQLDHHLLLHNDSLTGDMVSKCFVGLRNKECRGAVASIMTTLLNRTEKTALRAGDIANVLHGMSHMSSNASEVKRTLRWIHSSLKQNDIKFASPLLVKAITGMRCMQSECNEVRDVLRELAPHVKELQFSSEQLVRICSGIGHMNVSFEEVQRVLHVVEQQIRTKHEDFSTADLCLLLHYSRRLHSHEVLRQVVDLVTIRLRDPFADVICDDVLLVRSAVQDIPEDATRELLIELNKIKVDDEQPIAKSIGQRE